jgi:transposase
MVALLTGACRLSRRTVQRLLRDLFGLSLSLGTLAQLEADTAQALATPYKEVADAVPQAAVLGVDETSWRRGGTLYWLWTAVTRHYTFFRLDPHRNRDAYRALLGESATGPSPPGPVLVTDRYSAYHHLPPERRSLCWAHLARDFRAAAERGGVDGVVGAWVLQLLGELLEPWRQYRQGTLDRAALGTAVSARQEALRTPLDWGAEHGSRRTRALCHDLLARWPSLWTWLTVEDGEPTNNSAERALRPAVLWRKSSFGHQSDHGERYVERMLTVVGTLQRQHRNTWDYLVQACEAALKQQPAPRLLL